MQRIKYVYTEDRNGRPYTYFRRRKGTPKIDMQFKQNEPGFEAEYHGLMAQAANGTLTLPLARPVKKGHMDERGTKSVGGLARDYFESPVFARMHRKSQYDRRRYIERCLTVELPNKKGELKAFALFTLDQLTQPVVIKLRDKLPEPVRTAYANADTGAYHDKHVHALRAMFAWAVSVGRIIGNPASKIEPLGQESEGYHVWTDEEVAQFLAKWEIGSRPYLAFMLLRHTAARRSDLIKFGGPAAPVRNGVLHFNEQKFAASKVKRIIKPRAIKIRPALQAAIDATEGAKDPGPFLKTEKGTAFTAASFTHQFGVWCEQAGLPHCTAHGVRKWVATKIAEKGGSEHTIAAVLGHTSTKNVGIYTRKFRQAERFEAGMDALGD